MVLKLLRKKGTISFSAICNVNYTEIMQHRASVSSHLYSPGNAIPGDSLVFPAPITSKREILGGAGYDPKLGRFRNE